MEIYITIIAILVGAITFVALWILSLISREEKQIWLKEMGGKLQQ